MIIAALVGFWILSGIFSIVLLLHAEPIKTENQETITLIDCLFILWFIVFGVFAFIFVCEHYGKEIVVWRRKQ